MISVIILTWNSEKYIESCISSLFIDVKESGEEVEIFVIDGGSSDRTPKILDQLKTKYLNFNPIKLEKNLGTTVSRNIGIRESSGEYVFILDSDVEVQAGTLRILIETIEDEKRIGIVAPRLLLPDGSVQSSCKRFPTVNIKLCKFLSLEKTKEIAKKDELYDPKVYNKEFAQIIEVDHCISAAWMVNREAINDVGLLDENIFYAPEDVDYCLRMWLKGWKVVYNPSAIVIHHTQRASYKKRKVAWIHAKGLLYYFRKHGYWLNRKKIYAKIRMKEGTFRYEPGKLGC